MVASTFRELLESGDVLALLKCWATIAPHLPCPDGYEQGEITMHIARTATESVSFNKRAYSHAWLTERMLPSQLPDNLKPKAERLYPRVVSAVMIGAKARNPYFEPAVQEAQKAMEHAVLDAEADGRLEDAAFVKSRMMEARERTYRQLFGASKPQV